MMGGWRWSEQIAEAFWAAAGGRARFGRPVDLTRAVALTLPLGVCRMPALSTEKVAHVLHRVGTLPWTISRARPLRACLIADVGVGLVFLDCDDAPDEQLYSLAHEVAHFLAHYLEPRCRVLKALGTDMAEVLDRKREPTIAERLSAALRDVSLEPFRHAMARTPQGQTSHARTDAIEAEADLLALELLVPAGELHGRVESDPRGLAVEYGIPEWAVALLPTPTTGARNGGVIDIFRK
jgi:hypothetical protein